MYNRSQVSDLLPFGLLVSIRCPLSVYEFPITIKFLNFQTPNFFAVKYNSNKEAKP